MFIKFLFIINCMLVCIPCVAQANKFVSTSNHTTATNYSLQSMALNSQVDIQIHLPESYGKGKQSYPVLYVLDTQQHFNYAIGALNTLSSYQYTPEFIVVGVHVIPEKRGVWYYSEAQSFDTFIQTELFPFVGALLRSNDERILFGWELAGGFVLHSLTQSPNSFNAYLAASPTPIYGQYFGNALEKFEALKKTLKSQKVDDKFLYFTEARHDFPVQYGVQNLVQHLENNPPNKMRWEYKKWDNATHQETPFNTIYYGLKAHYYDYPHLQIDALGLAEFETMGGLNYIQTYYEKRQDRYNFSDEKTEKDRKNTHKHLILQAISENDFKRFNTYFNKFYTDFNALESVHPNQINNMAQFYLRHQKPDQAMQLLNHCLTQNPNSALHLNSQGDVYMFLNNHTKALQAYQQSVDKALENSDWRLPEFQAELIALRTQMGD